MIQAENVITATPAQQTTNTVTPAQNYQESSDPAEDTLPTNRVGEERDADILLREDPIPTNDIPRRRNNGVSRYPRYQKIFWLTENFD